MVLFSLLIQSLQQNSLDQKQKQQIQNEAEKILSNLELEIAQQKEEKIQQQQKKLQKISDIKNGIYEQEKLKRQQYKILKSEKVSKNQQNTIKKSTVSQKIQENCQNKNKEDEQEFLLRKFLSYANNLSYYFSKLSFDLDYDYQSRSLEYFKISINSFKSDLNSIQYLLNEKILKNQNSKDSDQNKKLEREYLSQPVYKEIQQFSDEYIQTFQQMGIEYIEPFLGFTGEINNLLNRPLTKRENDTIADDEEISGKYQDLRGIFLYGEKQETLFCIWHGSCQQYDWYSNFDQLQTSPQKGYLEKLDPTYKMAGGFGNVINQTLSVHQSLGQINSESLSFQDTVIQKSQNKKTLFFSGHSLGASLAQIATLYFKELCRENKNLRVRCWCFSAPRVFDNETCIKINEKLSKNNETEDIIRQNVFMDPVTQTFESSLDFQQSIRLYLNLISIVLNGPVYKGFQTYLKNNLEGTMKNIIANFALFKKNKLRDIPKAFFRQNFLGPYLNSLLEEKNISNFIYNIVDSSLDTQSIWFYLHGVISEQKMQEILGSRVKQHFPEIDLSDTYLLQDMLFSFGKMLELGKQGIHKKERLENIFFQSLRALENDEEMKKQFKQYIKEQQKNAFVSTFQSMGSGFMNFFKSIFTPSNYKKQKIRQQLQDNKLRYQFGFYLIRNAFETFLSHKKFYQCWNLLLEEPTWLSKYIWNYNDIGTLYLDVLEYDSILSKEQYFEPETKTLTYEEIPKKLQSLQTFLVEYFAPLHYGEGEGRFDHLRTFQKPLVNLKNQGKIYQSKGGNQTIFKDFQQKYFLKNPSYDEDGKLIFDYESLVAAEFIQFFTIDTQEKYDQTTSKSLIPYQKSIIDQFQSQTEINSKKLEVLKIVAYKENEIKAQNQESIDKEIIQNLTKLGDYSRSLKLPCKNQRCLEKNQPVLILQNSQQFQCESCKKKYNNLRYKLQCLNCKSFYCEECRP